MPCDVSRVRMLAVVAAACATLSLIAPGPAFAAPSFDCTKANQIEKVICDNETLATLDREIAADYKAALARIAADPAAAKALRESQQHFIELRNKGLRLAPDSAEQLATVEQFMKGHRDFLRRIAPRPRHELVGAWEAVGGSVTIKPAKRGKFAVSAHEVCGDPLWGNRCCDLGGDFTKRGATLASTNGAREWNQKLKRRGQLLVIEEIEPKGRKPDDRPEPDYCGANGRLDGWSFFPVRDPKSSE